MTDPLQVSDWFSAAKEASAFAVLVVAFVWMLWKGTDLLSGIREVLVAVNANMTGMRDNLTKLNESAAQQTSNLASLTQSVHEVATDVDQLRDRCGSQRTP